MQRSFALVALTALALVAAVSPNFAQTGPTSPPAANAGAGLNALASPSRMTPRHLADLLRREGHKVESKALPSGAEMVIATVERDGWRFVIEFEYNAAGTNLNVICPLGNAASTFSGAQLLSLMQKSYELPCPLHFSYRAADKRLCLEDPVYNPNNITDVQLRQVIDRLVNTVRRTHSLWDSSRWSQPQAPQVGTNN